MELSSEETKKPRSRTTGEQKFIVSLLTNPIYIIIFL